MSNNKIWIVGTAVLAVVIIALSGLLGIAPRLAEAALLDEQRTAAEAVNAAHAAEIANLETEFAGISDVRAELDSYRVTLPPEEDVDAFIDYIAAAITQSGVVFDSFTGGEPQGFLPTAPADSSATEPVLPAGAIEGAPAASPVSPENLMTVAVSVSVAGGYAQTLEFIRLMQHGDRIFLATAITTSDPTSVGGASAIYETSVEGVIYVLADPTWVDPKAATDAAAGEDADNTEAVPASELPAPTSTPTPAETPAPAETPTPGQTPTPTGTPAP